MTVVLAIAAIGILVLNALATLVNLGGAVCWLLDARRERRKRGDPE